MEDLVDYGDLNVLLMLRMILIITEQHTCR